MADPNAMMEDDGAIMEDGHQGTLIEDIRAEVDDTRALMEDTRANIEDTRAKVENGRTMTENTRTMTEGTMARMEDGRTNQGRGHQGHERTPRPRWKTRASSGGHQGQGGRVRTMIKDTRIMMDDTGP
jgi:hypothetical protein